MTLTAAIAVAFGMAFAGQDTTPRIVELKCKPKDTLEVLLLDPAGTVRQTVTYSGTKVKSIRGRAYPRAGEITFPDTPPHPSHPSHPSYPVHINPNPQDYKEFAEIFKKDPKYPPYPSFPSYPSHPEYETAARVLWDEIDIDFRGKSLLNPRGKPSVSVRRMKKGEPKSKVRIRDEASLANSQYSLAQEATRCCTAPEEEKKLCLKMYNVPHPDMPPGGAPDSEHRQ